MSASGTGQDERLVLDKSEGEGHGPRLEQGSQEKQAAQGRGPSTQGWDGHRGQKLLTGKKPGRHRGIRERPLLTGKQSTPVPIPKKSWAQEP